MTLIGLKISTAFSYTMVITAQSVNSMKEKTEGALKKTVYTCQVEVTQMLLFDSTQRGPSLSCNTDINMPLWQAKYQHIKLDKC